MKIARHSKIIELVNHYDIETQEELASRLNQAGFRVTQATVSRDIRELNLTKVAKPGGGAAKETPDGEKYIRVLREAFVSMDAAQNILVIKTGVGMANAAAVALDHMNWQEIVGSIAGDDTIACFSKSPEETMQLLNKLKKIIRE
mgnify:CR=1 FL=1